MQVSKGMEALLPVAERSRRGPARAHVYAALRDAIVSAQLAPGRQLSENELAELLGVSRTPDPRGAAAPARRAARRDRAAARHLRHAHQPGGGGRRAVRPRGARVRARSAAPRCAHATPTSRRCEANLAARTRAARPSDVDALLHARRRAAPACSATSAATTIAWALSQRAKGHLEPRPPAEPARARLPGEMVAEHRAVVAAVADARPRRRRGRAAPPPAHGPVQRSRASASSTPTTSRRTIA